MAGEPSRKGQSKVPQRRSKHKRPAKSSKTPAPRSETPTAPAPVLSITSPHKPSFPPVFVGNHCTSGAAAASERSRSRAQTSLPSSEPMPTKPFQPHPRTTAAWSFEPRPPVQMQAPLPPAQPPMLILPQVHTGAPAPSPQSCQEPYSNSANKADFFRLVFADLKEFYRHAPEDVVRGTAELLRCGLVPPNLPADVAKTVMEMSNLAKQTGKTWTFGPDGSIELAQSDDGVARGTEQEEGDVVWKYLSESELFEPEAMMVHLKPVVRYQLPSEDDRKPVVKENE